MFTARNRQNPFAKRRREQAEAESDSTPATAVAFNGNKSPEHTETPDIATFATGGVVEPLTMRDIEPEQSEPVFDIVAPEQSEPDMPVVIATPISAETQAKIDEIVNRVVTPVDVEPTSESETAAILADPATMEAIAEVEAEPKRGRGRPRPMETIVRDGKVYDLLKAADANEGVSKEALAISLDEKEQQVYSSLRQLTREGRAENRYVKGHGYRWFAVSPVETV